MCMEKSFAVNHGANPKKSGKKICSANIQTSIV